MNIKLKIKRMIYIALICICIMSFFCTLWIIRKKYKVNHGMQMNASIEVQVAWQGQDYSGIYEGTLKNGVPSGEGEFISADKKFIYNGEWGNGFFNGEGIIKNDGTEERGIYKKGQRNGFTTVIRSDGSYSQALYEKDIIVGKYCEYNSKGRQLKQIMYVNGEPVEQIVNSARKLTVDMIKNADNTDQYIYIEGKVQFVYQDTSTIFFRIHTDNLGTVIGETNNTSGRGITQAYMPNVQSGDTVRLYGIYDGYIKDMFEGDAEYYGYNFTAIDVVYAEIQDEKLTGYDELKINPFEKYGESIDGNFIVKYISRNGEKYRIFAVREDDPDENHIYLLSYKSKLDDIFFADEIIQIKGYYNGQFKKKIEERNQDIQSLNQQTTDGEEVGMRIKAIYPQIQVMQLLK